MNYPGKAKNSYHKEINYKNRGMDLEAIINEANEYYLKNDIALIYKKPTPIGIVKVDYNKMKITDAYFKDPSTLDYNGVYNGNYIEFDAKKTINKTAFPIRNIHEHQLIHIQNVIRHKGIAFLIIEINNEFYILNGIDLIHFIESNKRKSIPYDYIKDNGIKINYNYLKGLDYIEGLKRMMS